MNDISYLTLQQPLSLSLDNIYYKGEAPAPVVAVDVPNTRDPPLPTTSKPLKMELVTLWIFLVLWMSIAYPADEI